MAKVTKFPFKGLRKLIGGYDPTRVVEEFLSSIGQNPKECRDEDFYNKDLRRWEYKTKDKAKYEVLIEELLTREETTIYQGIDICEVPMHLAATVLPAALEIADGLVGLKVSLVGNFLVLSDTNQAEGSNVEEMLYIHQLMMIQRAWFRQELAKICAQLKIPGIELQVEEEPEGA